MGTMTYPIVLITVPPPTGHRSLRPHSRRGVIHHRRLAGGQASLCRLSVRQGPDFPKVEFRLVWTHPAPSSSSLASWRSASRRTSTFQGQLFHHQQASAGSYGPTMHRSSRTACGLPTSLMSLHHSDIALRGALIGSGSVGGWGSEVYSAAGMGFEVSRNPAHHPLDRRLPRGRLRSSV
jgi:hypothetical protein